MTCTTMARLPARQHVNPRSRSLLPPLPGQRGPPPARRHRLQPRESLASAGIASCHPELVTHEPATAVVQDRRAPHPACAVLHPPAGRELLDIGSVSANPRAHRATRVAPDVIEKTGHGGSDAD